MLGRPLALLDPGVERTDRRFRADRTAERAPSASGRRVVVVGDVGMTGGIKVPALVDAVVVTVVAIGDEVVAALCLRLRDVIGRPQLFNAEGDPRIEVRILVVGVAQPGAFKTYEPRRWILEVEFVPFVRVPGTRIHRVAVPEQQLGEPLEALSDEPHALVGHEDILSGRPDLSGPQASDILDILERVEIVDCVEYACTDGQG